MQRQETFGGHDKRAPQEQIAANLRRPDAMLSSLKERAAALQRIEIGDTTYHHQKSQHSGMKIEAAMRVA